MPARDRERTTLKTLTNPGNPIFSRRDDDRVHELTVGREEGNVFKRRSRPARCISFRKNERSSVAPLLVHGERKSNQTQFLSTIMHCRKREAISKNDPKLSLASQRREDASRATKSESAGEEERREQDDDERSISESTFDFRTRSSTSQDRGSQKIHCNVQSVDSSRHQAAEDKPRDYTGSKQQSETCYAQQITDDNGKLCASAAAESAEGARSTVTANTAATLEPDVAERSSLKKNELCNVVQKPTQKTGGKDCHTSSIITSSESDEDTCVQMSTVAQDCSRLKDKSPNESAHNPKHEFEKSSSSENKMVSMTDEITSVKCIHTPISQRRSFQKVKSSETIKSWFKDKKLSKYFRRKSNYFSEDSVVSSKKARRSSHKEENQTYSTSEIKSLGKQTDILESSTDNESDVIPASDRKISESETCSAAKVDQVAFTSEMHMQTSHIDSHIYSESLTKQANELLAIPVHINLSQIKTVLNPENQEQKDNSSIKTNMNYKMGVKKKLDFSDKDHVLSKKLKKNEMNTLLTNLIVNNIEIPNSERISENKQVDRNNEETNESQTSREEINATSTKDMQNLHKIGTMKRIKNKRIREKFRELFGDNPSKSESDEERRLLMRHECKKKRKCISSSDSEDSCVQKRYKLHVIAEGTEDTLEVLRDTVQQESQDTSETLNNITNEETQDTSETLHDIMNEETQDASEIFHHFIKEKTHIINQETEDASKIFHNIVKGKTHIINEKMQDTSETLRYSTNEETQKTSEMSHDINEETQNISEISYNIINEETQTSSETLRYSTNEETQRTSEMWHDTNEETQDTSKILRCSKNEEAQNVSEISYDIINEETQDALEIFRDIIKGKTDEMSVNESKKDIHNIVTPVKNRPTVVDTGNVTCVSENESDRDPSIEFSSDETNIKEDMSEENMQRIQTLIRKFTQQLGKKIQTTFEQQLQKAHNTLNLQKNQGPSDIESVTLVNTSLRTDKSTSPKKLSSTLLSEASSEKEDVTNISCNVSQNTDNLLLTNNDNTTDNIKTATADCVPTKTLDTSTRGNSEYTVTKNLFMPTDTHPKKMDTNMDDNKPEDAFSNRFSDIEIEIKVKSEFERTFSFAMPASSMTAFTDTFKNNLDVCKLGEFFQKSLKAHCLTTTSKNENKNKGVNMLEEQSVKKDIVENIKTAELDTKKVIYDSSLTTKAVISHSSGHQEQSSKNYIEVSDNHRKTTKYAQVEKDKCVKSAEQKTGIEKGVKSNYANDSGKLPKNSTDNINKIGASVDMGSAFFASSPSACEANANFAINSTNSIADHRQTENISPISNKNGYTPPEARLMLILQDIHSILMCYRNNKGCFINRPYLDAPSLYCRLNFFDDLINIKNLLQLKNIREAIDYTICNFNSTILRDQPTSAEELHILLVWDVSYYVAYKFGMKDSIKRITNNIPHASSMNVNPQSYENILHLQRSSEMPSVNRSQFSGTASNTLSSNLRMPNISQQQIPGNMHSSPYMPQPRQPPPSYVSRNNPLVTHLAAPRPNQPSQNVSNLTYNQYKPPEDASNFYDQRSFRNNSQQTLLLNRASVPTSNINVHASFGPINPNNTSSFNVTKPRAKTPNSYVNNIPASFGPTIPNSMSLPSATAYRAKAPETTTKHYSGTTAYNLNAQQQSQAYLQRSMMTDPANIISPTATNCNNAYQATSCLSAPTFFAGNVPLNQTKTGTTAESIGSVNPQSSQIPEIIPSSLSNNVPKHIYSNTRAEYVSSASRESRPNTTTVASQHVYSNVESHVTLSTISKSLDKLSREKIMQQNRASSISQQQNLQGNVPATSSVPFTYPPNLSNNISQNMRSTNNANVGVMTAAAQQAKASPIVQQQNLPWHVPVSSSVQFAHLSNLSNNIPQNIQSTSNVNAGVRTTIAQQATASSISQRQNLQCNVPASSFIPSAHLSNQSNNIPQNVQSTSNANVGVRTTIAQQATASSISQQQNLQCNIPASNSIPLAHPLNLSNNKPQNMQSTNNANVGVKTTIAQQAKASPIVQQQNLPWHVPASSSILFARLSNSSNNIPQNTQSTSNVNAGVRTTVAQQAAASSIMQQQNLPWHVPASSSVPLAHPLNLSNNIPQNTQSTSNANVGVRTTIAQQAEESPIVQQQNLPCYVLVSNSVPFAYLSNLSNNTPQNIQSTSNVNAGVRTTVAQQATASSISQHQNLQCNVPASSSIPSAHPLNPSNNIPQNVQSTSNANVSVRRRQTQKKKQSCDLTTSRDVHPNAMSGTQNASWNMESSAVPETFMSYQSTTPHNMPNELTTNNMIHNMIIDLTDESAEPHVQQVPLSTFTTELPASLPKTVSTQEQEQEKQTADNTYNIMFMTEVQKVMLHNQIEKYLEMKIDHWMCKLDNQKQKKMNTDRDLLRKLDHCLQKYIHMLHKSENDGVTRKNQIQSSSSTSVNVQSNTNRLKQSLNDNNNPNTPTNSVLTAVKSSPSIIKSQNKELRQISALDLAIPKGSSSRLQELNQYNKTPVSQYNHSIQSLLDTKEIKTAGKLLQKSRKTSGTNVITEESHEDSETKRQNITKSNKNLNSLLSKDSCNKQLSELSSPPSLQNTSNLSEDKLDNRSKEQLDLSKDSCNKQLIELSSPPSPQNTSNLSQNKLDNKSKEQLDLSKDSCNKQLIELSSPPSPQNTSHLSQNKLDNRSKEQLDLSKDSCNKQLIELSSPPSPQNTSNLSQNKLDNKSKEQLDLSKDSCNKQLIELSSPPSPQNTSNLSQNKLDNKSKEQLDVAESNVNVKKHDLMEVDNVNKSPHTVTQGNDKDDVIICNEDKNEETCNDKISKDLEGEVQDSELDFSETISKDLEVQDSKLDFNETIPGNFDSIYLYSPISSVSDDMSKAVDKCEVESMSQADDDFSDDEISIFLKLNEKNEQHFTDEQSRSSLAEEIYNETHPGEQTAEESTEKSNSDSHQEQHIEVLTDEDKLNILQDKSNSIKHQSEEKSQLLLEDIDKERDPSNSCSTIQSTVFIAQDVKFKPLKTEETHLQDIPSSEIPQDTSITEKNEIQLADVIKQCEDTENKEMELCDDMKATEKLKSYQSELTHKISENVDTPIKEDSSTKIEEDVENDISKTVDYNSMDIKNFETTNLTIQNVRSISASFFENINNIDNMFAEYKLLHLKEEKLDIKEEELLNIKEDDLSYINDYIEILD